MKKRYWLLGIIVVIALAFWWLVQLLPDRVGGARFVETTTPADGAVFAAPPNNLVIDTNTDLLPTSTIKITGPDALMLDELEPRIDDNQLTLRTSLPANLPDGDYVAEYRVCVTGERCEADQVRFKIERTRQQAFSDQTDATKVKIAIENITLEPALVKISAGTTVTWENRDPFEHFINTDSHPAHTYYLPQNSLGLDQGETYELTFTEPGIYPYHCSAHPEMMGTILVE
jgi:plastocyanin